MHVPRDRDQGMPTVDALPVCDSESADRDGPTAPPVEVLAARGAPPSAGGGEEDVDAAKCAESPDAGSETSCGSFNSRAAEPKGGDEDEAGSDSASHSVTGEAGENCNSESQGQGLWTHFNGRASEDVFPSDISRNDQQPVKRKLENRAYVPEHVSYQHRLKSLALDLEVLEEVQQKSSPELRWDDHETSVTIHSAVNLLKNQVAVLEYNKMIAEAGLPQKGVKAKLRAVGDRVQRFVAGSTPVAEQAALPDHSAHSQTSNHSAPASSRQVRICAPQFAVSMEDCEMHIFARPTGERDDPTLEESHGGGAGGIMPYSKRAPRSEPSDDSLCGITIISKPPCGDGKDASQGGICSIASSARTACCAGCLAAAFAMAECLAGGD